MNKSGQKRIKKVVKTGKTRAQKTADKPVVIDLVSDSSHSTDSECVVVDEVIAGVQEVNLLETIEQQDSNGSDQTAILSDGNTVVNTDSDEWDVSSVEEEPKKEPNLKAEFDGSIIGDKHALWSVKFNTYLPDGHNYFAAVGSDKVMVFECPSDGGIRLVQCFAEPKPYVSPSEETDKTIRKVEDFYSCCWSYAEVTGNPLVIAGGYRGVIRIIDCGLKKHSHLLGHGGAINDLKISPFDKNLLLSSSEDHSLRLWNLRTSICIAKFGGDSGHRDQVICADFYTLSDKYFVSTGMDHSIKIWSLDKPEVRTAIKESYNTTDGEDKSFPVSCQHFPVFMSRKVHTNYIDCVQFFGRFLLSKSCNEIIISKPELLDQNTRIHENRISEEITSFGVFKLKDNNYWFIKFSMDSEQNLLSVGNNSGVTFVWDMSVDDPFEYKPLVLERNKCKAVIRQTSFSEDGSILICVCDDSTIWRWNITRD